VTRRLVDDDLWALIAPLIPPRPPARQGRTGRPRVDDRAALEGILFIMQTGVPWQELPIELEFGSGSTCWRRLRAWQQADVWDELHRCVLDRLGPARVLAWACARQMPSSDAQRRTGSPSKSQSSSTFIGTGGRSPLPTAAPSP
jgi:transposase